MSIALIGRMIANRAGRKPVVATDGPLAHCAEKGLRKLRLGGVLDFAGGEATFIVTESLGSFLKRPGNPVAINGYGVIADGEFTIHRFYFHDYFLQVIVNKQQIATGEVKLFQKLAEVVPQSPEEWDLWLKGSPDAPPLLTGPTINWQDTAEFTRVWSPGPKAVEPKRFAEVLDVGAENERPGVAHACMLFSRQLGGGTEWLQISMCRGGSERWIEAYVGVTFSPGELSAI